VTIGFTPDSNEFAVGGSDALNRFAELAGQYPRTRVRVIGYSDATGNESYNIRLSAFRAQVVKSYLLGQGIDAGRIDTEGKGSADPVATNDTAEGRQANRRVEVSLETP